MPERSQLNQVIDKWQWGGWSEIDWPAGLERLAVAQRVTEWFRGQAALMGNEPLGRQPLSQQPPDAGLSPTSERPSESVAILDTLLSDVDDWGQAMTTEEELALITRMLGATGRLHDRIRDRLEVLALVVQEQLDTPERLASEEGQRGPSSRRPRGKVEGDHDVPEQRP